MRNDEESQALRRALVLFEPIEDLCRRITDVRTLWEYRIELRQLPYDPLLLGHLVRLVRTAIENHERFRVFDCLRILRTQVIESDCTRLPESIVRDLFAIYRSRILESREEVQWCLSRLIKSQLLAEDELDWILLNWHRSKHLANRLLLYPTSDSRIQNWALERYRAGDLPGRESEIVAIILPQLRIGALEGLNEETLAWAVMRSSLPERQKLDTLLEIAPRLPAQTAIEIATRMGFADVIHAALLAGKNPGG